MRSAQVATALLVATTLGGNGVKPLKVVASVLREEDKIGCTGSNVAREFASTQAAQ